MTTFVASTSGGPVDGTSGNDVIIGKSGDDIIDGGAGADVLLGGAGDDLIVYDEFDIKVDGGSGYDILLFKGTGQTLNLGLQKTVMNFERIDLAGGGGHSLIFSAADVLRTSDLDSLLVYGSRSSHVTFSDSGWTFQGYGNGLSKFGNGSAIAYIDNAVYVTGFSENAALQQTGATGVTEDLNRDAFNNLVASGTISVSDPDAGQSMMLDMVTATGSPLGTLTLLPGAVPGISNGSYRYTVANGVTQYLAATEQRTENFTVKSVDGTTLSLTFTISGVNDAPVRSDSTSQSASVDEIDDGAPGENTATTTRTGSFVITDVDLSDTLTCWVESPAGSHGTLTVESITAPSTTGERTVSWKYVVADASLDKLRDALFIENSTIHVSDRPQGTAGATVVDVAVQVSLNGANDGVEVLPLRAGVDVVERTVTESANTTGSTTNQTLGFQFQARDVDLQDVFTVAATGTSAAASPIGTLGSGSSSNYDAATGTRDVQYTFQWQDRQLDYLAQDQTLDQQFQVSVADQQTTAYQTITLHFVGANDAPVRQSSGTIAATVTEIADGATGENINSHTLTGSFVVRDVDQTDSLSRWIVNPASPRGTLSVTSITSPDANGDRTVNWQYVVADSALDSLRASQSTVENFSIKVSDRAQNTAGATVLDIPVAITLNGANDAPVRNVVNTDVITGSVTELASNAANANSGTYFHTATGSFQVKDVDIGDTLSQQSIVQSAPNNALYGTLTISSISSADASGLRTVSWSYAVSDLALNPLPAGAGPLQTFAITLKDSSNATVSQSVNISLTGAADGPAFGGDLVKGVTEFSDGDPGENFVVHTISGTVTATNMPAGSLSVTEVGFPGELAFGSFSASASAIDANGNATISWTYTVADCLLDILDGSQFDNVQLLITHSANAQITQRVSIALTGTPDSLLSPEVTYADPFGNTADFSTSAFPPPAFIALQVYGLDNDDTLRTGISAPQTLFGGADNDVFKLSSGLVFAVGGSGNDRFDFMAGGATVWAWGQQGVDTFNLVNADPTAKLWAMDFTLGEDHIATAAAPAQYTLTQGTTSATNTTAEGYNPNVADGTPYYLLTGPNDSNQAIHLHIIGSELPNLNPAAIIA